MKALYFEQHGELDVIQYGDVPEPETGHGQIKIRDGRTSGLVGVEAGLTLRIGG